MTSYDEPLGYDFGAIGYPNKGLCSRRSLYGLIGCQCYLMITLVCGMVHEASLP